MGPTPKSLTKLASPPILGIMAGLLPFLFDFCRVDPYAMILEPFVQLGWIFEALLHSPTLPILSSRDTRVIWWSCCLNHPDEQALGADHADEATTLKDYAGMLRKISRTEEVEKLEARAKAIREKPPQ